MTANDFRKLALALPDTEERAHMNHPDFRVAGKIFATLGYPDKTRGMVKLSPEDQHNFTKDFPEMFVPVKGVWGKQGATSVFLKAAGKKTMQEALQAAWRNTAPKKKSTPASKKRKTKSQSDAAADTARSHFRSAISKSS